MDRTTQVALVGRIFELLDQRGTDLAPAPLRLPASEYVSAEQFETERRVLFREEAILAGLSADAPRPGDYFTVDAAGVPLVFIRDAGGAIGGFLNVCRHRGATVAHGRGQAGAGLVCPYHAWTYGTDGALRAQPGSAGGFEGLDKSGLGLVSVPVTERHGLVFARPGGGAPINVDEVLGGLAPELAGYDLESYHHFETRTTEWSCNWKFLIDTFFESYHVFSLHRQTIATEYFSSPSLFDTFGPHGRFVGARRVIGELRDRPAAEWELLPNARLQYSIVPNVVLAHQVDHVELWKVFPVDVNRAVAHTSLYAPDAPDSEAAMRYWNRHLDILLSVTTSEDFPQVEDIHRNLASGAAAEVVIGRNEPGVIHFHQSIRKLLGLD